MVDYFIDARALSQSLHLQELAEREDSCDDCDCDLDVRIVGTVPRKGTVGSSGFDLVAAVSESVLIPKGWIAVIPSGIRIEMPIGWEAQVRSRSGLSTKQGLQVINAPGTIDSDYRGEIGIPLINLSDRDQIVEPGQRVAQLVFARIPSVRWIQVASLDSSVRGEGGFGSTGL